MGTIYSSVFVLATLNLQVVMKSVTSWFSSYIVHQKSDSELCMYFLLQTLTNAQIKPISAIRMPLAQIPQARSTAFAILDTLEMVCIVKVAVSFIPSICRVQCGIIEWTWSKALLLKWSLWAFVSFACVHFVQITKPPFFCCFSKP